MLADLTRKVVFDVSLPLSSIPRCYADTLPLHQNVGFLSLLSYDNTSPTVCRVSNDIPLFSSFSPTGAPEFFSLAAIMHCPGSQGRYSEIPVTRAGSCQSRTAFCDT